MAFMATTIQVLNTTKQRLTIVKEIEHIQTYDQVVQHLLDKHSPIPKSMFGSAKGLKPWKKETDRMKFDHER